MGKLLRTLCAVPDYSFKVHLKKTATYVDGLNVKNALDKEHESKSFG